MYMKSFLILYFLVFGALAIASDSIPTKIVNQYGFNSQNSIQIPVSFGKPVLVAPEIAERLEGQKIHHIDLVYTQNKVNTTFDQQALNQSRIDELKEVLPQIESDNPSWMLIEQTGAQSKTEALEYFHGFAVYFGSAVVPKNLYSTYQKPFQKFTINANEGAEIEIESGSTIHIPANAILKNGEQIEGDFTFQYREFRNQSEILFSGISHDIEENGSDSYGMFEIRSEQDGEALTLQKPVTVDFNCTKTGEGVEFASLNDSTEKWTKLQPITFEDASGPKVWTWKEEIRGNEAKIYLDKSVLNDVEKSILNDPYWGTEERKLVIDKEQNTVILESDDFEDFLAFLFKCKSDTESKSQTSAKEPTLVLGLETEGFGVFNCYGEHQQKAPIRIFPTYLDESTGKEISNQQTASVINKEINNVRTYHPHVINCETKGENMVLLFTNDGKIFMSHALSTSKNKLSDNDNIELKMIDITNQVQSSSDLVKILGL